MEVSPVVLHPPLTRFHDRAVLRGERVRHAGFYIHTRDHRAVDGRHGNRRHF